MNGPGHKEKVIQCQIVRSKGRAPMQYPKYMLYLEEKNSKLRFMLSARKRKKSKSSNYLISLDEEDQARKSKTYFGKLRSNFVGTEFIMYDKGISH